LLVAGGPSSMEAYIGDNAWDEDAPEDTTDCLDHLTQPLDSWDFPSWWDDVVIPAVTASPVTHVLHREFRGVWKEYTKAEWLKAF
ncbi:MAG: hypothetical protein GTN93_27945, partial [Anaerolineae bacterium]|nr:hypothetical protein [Anaerolineae bacterium]